MDLASHLHMPLAKCLKEITHREFLTWMEYLRKQLDAPSKTEWYLISIATEVRRVLSKRPNSIRLDHLKLKIGGSSTPKMSRKAAASASKASWLGHLGSKIIRKFKSKQEIDGN